MNHPRYKTIIFILAILSLASCTTGTKDAGNKSADSPVAVATVLNKLPGLFAKDLSLPFLADSSFLAKRNFGDSLGTNEIKILTENSFKSKENNGMDYELREFYKIDSVKATGTYAKWCDKLDIGMTKYSAAYAIGKLTVNGTTGVVWAFSQSSYEACPWSNSTKIFLTIADTSFGESFLLGESYGAGDAPVSMLKETFGKINPDGKIFQATEEENDDADATESEVTVSDAEHLIKDGKIILIKQNKGQVIKVPHLPVSE